MEENPVFKEMFFGGKKEEGGVSPSPAPNQTTEAKPKPLWQPPKEGSLAETALRLAEKQARKKRPRWQTDQTVTAGLARQLGKGEDN